MQVLLVNDSEKEEFSIAKNKVDKVKNYIQNVSFEDDLIVFLQEKNFNHTTFKNGGFDVLVNLFLNSNSNQLQQFIDFTKLPKVSLWDNQKGNILDKCKLLGLDANFVIKLFESTFTDAKGNNIGPGEILFGLIFEDTKNDTSTGDLLYNGVRLEVKCRGGRFGERPNGGLQLSPNMFIAAETSSKNLIFHICEGYYASQDKSSFFKHILSSLDKIYGRGNKIAHIFLKESDVNPLTLKNKIAKIYIYGKMLSQKLSHILFINSEYDYMLVERYDLLKNGGLIDTNVISVGEIKTNDLYPQVHLNNINNAQIQGVFQF